LKYRPPAGIGDGTSVVSLRRAFLHVSSSDFRQLPIKGETGKADRLFRAAVSAFCSLTRPSRREIDQLEDLALPLFDAVSVESKRFVAAALSECAHPPAMLVRRLCDETVDIAAPLLIRSTSLSDVDLIALIGRHGLPHAHAIQRRPNLNKAIFDLTRALTAAASPMDDPPGSQSIHKSTRHVSNEQVASNDATADSVPLSEADRVRNRLRTLMRSADEPSVAAARWKTVSREDFVKLRATVLSGNRALFQTALADTLGIGFQLARVLTERPRYDELIAALRALDLAEEHAFLLTAALYPAAVNGTEGIRIFLDRYRLCGVEAARRQLQAWEAELQTGSQGNSSAS
jgi:uncharacterized protein (DUF2336 family)